MKAKRILLTSLVFGSMLHAYAQILPKFSNDQETTWYYLQFAKNKSVIQDMGKDQPLQNKEPVEDSDAQLWKFTGRKDSCVLISKLNRKLSYDRNLNRCNASDLNYTVMELVENDKGKWEIQIKDKKQAPASNANAIALVMNGGDGFNKIIDLWKHNFEACGMDFIVPEDMEFLTQQPPVAVSEAKISPKMSAPEEPLSLWYQQPATNWVTQALPIGGGDFGAMIFGGIVQDRIQFNHKTLWKGSSQTGDLGSYLNFGDLYIINKNHEDVTNYQRSLNLKEAMASVDYTQNGVDYRKEYFASFPSKVIAIRYTASEAESLNLELQFINGQGNRASYASSGAEFYGTLANGMNYRAKMRIELDGGKSVATKSGIEISDAQSLVIYIACNTDFDPLAENHMTGNTEELNNNLENNLEEACRKGYESVRQEHIEDYQSLFNRVDFHLDGANFGSSTKTLLTDQNQDQSYSKALDMLVFQYGRYLTIASSRGVALPSNLQGIWNKDGNATTNAVWASDIHSNINVQMNYWPAEPTNLSECHWPLLQYIYNEATRPNGTWKKNAQDLGINKGWVVNTAGNIFGGSSTYKVGKYAVANAWLCEHLWQHFTYTCDTVYLRNIAFPLMKSACEFWLDRLVEGPDGTWECPNEYSPEQGRVQNATAHSQQLVTELFTNTLSALDVVGEDQTEESFRQELEDKLARLDRGLRINQDGEIREWKYQENTPNQAANQNYFADDEANVWQCHRHTSHLMALYPGFEIDPGKTPDLFKAAIVSLQDRGDTGTGWALAWRVSLWSRARDAYQAYHMLRQFSTYTESLTYNWYGGLYENMLDAHATSVFQIDGNFGATAGIAEMILQSRPDSIVILPALPSQWATGKMKGLKAIGNFEIDVEWDQHQLSRLHIHSYSGRPVSLAYPNIENAVVTTMDGDVLTDKRSQKNLITFNTEAGKEYDITFKQQTGISSVTDSKKLPVKIYKNRIYTSEPDQRVEIFDLSGRNLSQTKMLSTGTYIIRSKDASEVVFVP